MSLNAANENLDAAEELSEMNCGSDIDDKLASIQCPFTWIKNWKEIYVAAEHGEIIQERESQRLRMIEDKKEYFPEIVLIFHLDKAFKKETINQLTEAIEHLNTAESTLSDLKQNGTLKNVEKVLDHIFIGTKCHFLRKQGHQAEVVELLEQIRYVEDMNNIELAMLSGCRCSALSLTDSDYTERIEAAKKAIEYEPDNGKWHFKLAKKYRKLRRNKLDLVQVPDDNEISAFEEAYRLWKNPLFCVSLAQLYRECRQYARATEIYKEVYALKPKSHMIQLQLALGFIRARESTLAKDCLDYVAAEMPDNLRYLHYMALYEEKCSGNDTAALSYYEKTTKKLNSSAERQYIDCKHRVDKEWDPLPYLLELLEKYDGYHDHVIQEINTYIGTYYLYEKNDILSACVYFSKAIKMQPNSRMLTELIRLFTYGVRVNIYDELEREVSYALNLDIYDENQIEILNDTLQLCRDNHRSPAASTRPSISETSFKPKSSNYNRNCTKRSSSQETSNWRKEERNSVSQGISKTHLARFHDDERASTHRNRYPWNARDPASSSSNWRVPEHKATKNISENRFETKIGWQFADFQRSAGKSSSPSANYHDRKNMGERRNASCGLEALEDLNL